MGSNFALGPGPGGSCLEGQVVGKGREGGREGGKGGGGGNGESGYLVHKIRAG